MKLYSHGTHLLSWTYSPHSCMVKNSFKNHILCIELREVCTLTVVLDICWVEVSAQQHGPVLKHSSGYDPYSQTLFLWDMQPLMCMVLCTILRSVFFNANRNYHEKVINNAKLCCKYKPTFQIRRSSKMIPRFVKDIWILTLLLIRTIYRDVVRKPAWNLVLR